MKRLLILSSFALSITACEKNEIELPDSETERLLKTWNWVVSSGGFSGQGAPHPDGYTEKVTYGEDGTFTKIINEEVLYEFTFDFEERESIFSGVVVPMIIYSSENEVYTPVHSYEFRGTDTLILNEECYDCFSHIYVKE